MAPTSNEPQGFSSPSQQVGEDLPCTVPQIDLTSAAEVYKERSKIELFFKSLKQLLRVKTFVGTSAELSPTIATWTSSVPAASAYSGDQYSSLKFSFSTSPGRRVCTRFAAFGTSGYSEPSLRTGFKMWRPARQHGNGQGEG